MYITKVPLRVSLLGGGTDFPEYYNHYKPSNILSFSINKYVYVGTKNKFDENIRVSYSKSEHVKNISSIKHDIVRESLKFFNIEKSVEIFSVADIPSNGTGLGSSSAFTIGLIKSLNALKDLNIVNPEILAFNIERNLLSKPIGIQDHIGCYHPGIKHFTITHQNKYTLSFINNENIIHDLEDTLMLMYLGSSRKSENILSYQRDNIHKNSFILEEISVLCQEQIEEIEKGSIKNLGPRLDKYWQLKKKLSENISNNYVESMYNKALNLGASGGKLCGAGQTGFLLLVADKNIQNNIERNLGLKRMYIKIDREGAITRKF